MENRRYELHKMMHDSKGMEFMNRMKVRSFSFNIFTGNLRELQENLKLVENPEVGLKLMSEGNRDAGTQVHREINRMFHNFLASAATLTDHTRIFINTYYKGTPVETAYQSKIDSEYSSDELCRFIKDLRNFMLHCGLPDNNMSLTITGGQEATIESTISLNVERLKNWSSWSAASKKFLDKQGKNLKLSSIVPDYGEKISALYEWLDTKLRKHHKNDIAELQSLQQQYQALDKDSAP
jgi:hypothetical protein